VAISTADGWFAAARQRVRIAKTASATTVAAQQFSTFALAGNPGAGTLAVGNTTTGVLFANTTAGSPQINAFGGAATGYLGAAYFRNSVAGGAQLYDRVWGAGAVSMTALATTPFSGQPSITGRVPGGTDYGDFVILLELTTTVSATATTVSVSYTNEAATAGRTTGASASLSGLTTPRVIEMPLQAGDKWPTKIDSVTVGGTVATAGAFNVILARKIAEFDVRIANGADVQAWDMTGAPILFASMCPWLVTQADGTSSGLPSLTMTILNG
jgi:hypothetical protein